MAKSQPIQTPLDLTCATFRPGEAPPPLVALRCGRKTSPLSEVCRTQRLHQMCSRKQLYPSSTQETVAGHARHHRSMGSSRPWCFAQSLAGTRDTSRGILSDPSPDKVGLRTLRSSQVRSTVPVFRLDGPYSPKGMNARVGHVRRDWFDVDVQSTPL